MKKTGLAVLFLIIGIFTIVTGVWVSHVMEQKVFLVIIGVFFIICSVSNFLNRKSK